MYVPNGTFSLPVVIILTGISQRNDEEIAILPFRVFALLYCAPRRKTAPGRYAAGSGIYLY